MEAFGIALYAAAGLVASPLFCFLVARYSGRFGRLALALWWTSLGVFAAFAVLTTWVSLVGAVSARALVGLPFFPVATFLALFAAPAVACVLLVGRPRLSRWWPAVAFLAWCVGVFAILFQYDVADSLYGIDGSGGPYSKIDFQ